jgi:hypothetical protein
MIDREVSTSIGDDLLAIEEGHAQLRQEIADYLGPLSVSESVVEQRRNETRQARSNVEFLTDFAVQLPKAECTEPYYGREGSYRFSIVEGNVQNTLAMIQTNVMWIDTVPHYILGRRVSLHKPNTEEVLMLSAYHINVSRGERRLRIYQFRRDDMVSRDELTPRFSARELTEEEIESNLDRVTGNYILTDEDKNNVKTTEYFQKKETSPDFVREHGVRFQKKARYESKTIVTMTKSELDEFHVDETITKLAFDFNLEGKLRKLMGLGDEKIVETEGVFEERVLQQNEELKASLRRMLIMSGMITREDADAMIENRFPNLSPKDKR